MFLQILNVICNRSKLFIPCTLYAKIHAKKRKQMVSSLVGKQQYQAYVLLQKRISVRTKIRYHVGSLTWIFLYHSFLSDTHLFFQRTCFLLFLASMFLYMYPFLTSYSCSFQPKLHIRLAFAQTVYETILSHHFTPKLSNMFERLPVHL